MRLPDALRRRVAGRASTEAVRLGSGDTTTAAHHAVTHVDEPEQYVPVASPTPAMPINVGELEIAIRALLTEAQPAIDGLNPEFLDEYLRTRTPLHDAAVDDGLPSQVRAAARIRNITERLLAVATNDLHDLLRPYEETLAEETHQRSQLLGSRDPRPTQCTTTVLMSSIEPGPNLVDTAEFRTTLDALLLRHHQPPTVDESTRRK